MILLPGKERCCGKSDGFIYASHVASIGELFYRGSQLARNGGVVG